MIKPKVFKAWAIHTQSTEGHGFIGAGWWFKNQRPEIPEQLQACRIALFTTRAIARDNLQYVRVKYGFPKAKVIRVTIEVKP